MSGQITEITGKRTHNKDVWRVISTPEDYRFNGRVDGRPPSDRPARIGGYAYEETTPATPSKAEHLKPKNWGSAAAGRVLGTRNPVSFVMNSMGQPPEVMLGANMSIYSGRQAPLLGMEETEGVLHASEGGDIFSAVMDETNLKKAHIMSLLKMAGLNTSGGSGESSQTKVSESDMKLALKAQEVLNCFQTFRNWIAEGRWDFLFRESSIKKREVKVPTEVDGQSMEVLVSLPGGRVDSLAVEFAENIGEKQRQDILFRLGGMNMSKLSADQMIYYMAPIEGIRKISLIEMKFGHPDSFSNVAKEKNEGQIKKYLARVNANLADMAAKTRHGNPPPEVDGYLIYLGPDSTVHEEYFEADPLLEITKEEVLTLVENKKMRASVKAWEGELKRKHSAILSDIENMYIRKIYKRGLERGEIDLMDIVLLAKWGFATFSKEDNCIILGGEGGKLVTISLWESDETPVQTISGLDMDSIQQGIESGTISNIGVYLKANVPQGENIVQSRIVNSYGESVAISPQLALNAIQMYL